MGSISKKRQAVAKYRISRGLPTFGELCENRALNTARTGNGGAGKPAKTARETIAGKFDRFNTENFYTKNGHTVEIDAADYRGFAVSDDTSDKAEQAERAKFQRAKEGPGTLDALKTKIADTQAINADMVVNEQKYVNARIAQKTGPALPSARDIRQDTRENAKRNKARQDNQALSLRGK